MRDDHDDSRTNADADMTGDATTQVAPTESTASPMVSSGLSGAGGGAFASSADVHGPAMSATGAVTAGGRRLRLRFPSAPGGHTSPQAPGATPDFSTIPGERVPRSPRVDAVRHPAVQAGTAEGIMGFHDAAPGEERDPERFELGLTSFEEQRKSQPTLQTPGRPVQSVSGLGEPSWQRPSLGAGEGTPAPPPAESSQTADRS